MRHLARYLRDDVLPMQRLRQANGSASIGVGVRFRGDAGRVRLAQQVTIAAPTFISVENGGGLDGASLSIGERTYVGEFNNIRCAGAPIRIGADCLISQHITIVGSNHKIVAGTPIGGQPWYGDGVEIGDDVWVGANCVLLPGARIGSGAVIAAGSVVRGTVAPDAIVAGQPARQIGTRPAG